MDNLSTDIILNIIKTLDFKDMINISKINKYFRNIIRDNNNNISIYMVVNKFNCHILDDCLKYYPKTKLCYNNLKHYDETIMNKYNNNWYELNLFNCKNITDSLLINYDFKNIHTLKISHCNKITGYFLGNYTLKNVHTLDLSECVNITDFSINSGDLSNVHTLKLSHCKNITDFFLNSLALSNVHTLRL